MSFKIDPKAILTMALTAGALLLSQIASDRRLEELVEEKVNEKLALADEEKEES